ncbi:MAG: nuclear transport factor 2 family protein [Gammaproteobacteria bacterium]
MSDNHELLQALIDREAIRDLPKRYCDRVWQDDALGMSMLFTENGRFSVVLEDRTIDVHGRAGILDFMRDGLADAPRPFIHNHVVELVDSHHATGRAYLDLRSGKHNFDWLGAGYYEDRYTKEADTWLFESRDFHALRIDEWPGEIDTRS